MSRELLPIFAQPPLPPDDMELTADNVCKLHEELRDWYKRTEAGLPKHPSYVGEELSQLRQLYAFVFHPAYSCGSHSCKKERPFSEAVAAYHAGRYVSPIIYQQGSVQYTVEEFPKVCDDEKFTCPRCKRPIELLRGFPGHTGYWTALVIEEEIK